MAIHPFDDGEVPLSAFVLAKVLDRDVEDSEMTVAAGDFVWAPRGLPHTFRVESQTARLLGGIPAGFEEFFLATGRPAAELTLPPPPDGPPNLEQMLPQAQAAGCDILGPPMLPNGTRA